VKALMASLVADSKGPLVDEDGQPWRGTASAVSRPNTCTREVRRNFHRRIQMVNGLLDL
jgi:hypothetical protein